ncbi:hypothetical protein [Endozoicomonas arenosclerae]|uniref:hypothetical protein n=1 Tax=Endozoicomonas arenosclerae TaxID=1633495 RepID=UPI000783124E|nr:hypothetical protein [Endozoicomonas arenosclerae]
MSITRSLYILLAMALILSGCQTVEPIRTNTSNNAEGGVQELIINSRVSLPAPIGYDKVWLIKSSVIVSKAGSSVVYRWIDKEEMEFIGSKKTPYNFFKSALNNPETVEEKGFLEGLDSKVNRMAASDESLEIYSFDHGEGQQIYILSDTLDFVVEITSKGYVSEYFENLIKYSYTR